MQAKKAAGLPSAHADSCSLNPTTPRHNQLLPACLFSLEEWKRSIFELDTRRDETEEEQKTTTYLFL
jgi:hypothetical protein